MPKRVKKIAAYTPVWFQDDFIIVSAVIDYDEIAAPHQQGHDQRVLTDNCAYDHLRGGSL